MPFYEYRCTACQHQDTFLESINAPQKKTCPQCGKRGAFKRLVSAAGFQLKGDGWYVTDFKNKDKPAAKKGDKDSGTEKSASTDSKSDSGSEKSAGDSKSADKGKSGDSKPDSKKSTAKSAAK